MDATTRILVLYRAPGGKWKGNRSLRFPASRAADESDHRQVRRLPEPLDLADAPLRTAPRGALPTVRAHAPSNETIYCNGRSTKIARPWRGQGRPPTTFCRHVRREVRRSPMKEAEKQIKLREKYLQLEVERLGGKQ